MPANGPATYWAYSSTRIPSGVAATSSRGNPSPRRAITVRWISAAPPEIVVATDAR